MVGRFTQYCTSHFENIWRFQRFHKIYWVGSMPSVYCRQKPQSLVSYKEDIPGCSKPEFCYICINNDLNISKSSGPPDTWKKHWTKSKLPQLVVAKIHNVR